MILVGVAVGGALGSVLRYLIHTQSTQWFGNTFPYGTLLINIVGSLLIGFLSYTLIERITVTEELRFAILVGLLGGFTTFSTFSMETLNLVMQGQVISAIANVLLSVVVCLFACFVGLSLARAI